jgi:hypothetical protein
VIYLPITDDAEIFRVHNIGCNFTPMKHTGEKVNNGGQNAAIIG